jgi:uncharacterized protein (AIM24 family)
MLNPVSTTASWLGGRFLLFLAILAALVAWDAYRDDSALLGAHLKGMLPDREILTQLESGRDALAEFARQQERQINERLRSAAAQTTAEIDARIAELQASIASKNRQRRSPTEKMLGMLSGKGFEEDLQVEIEIQLLSAEQTALTRIREQVDSRRALIGSLELALRAAKARTREACGRYFAARGARDAHEASNPILSKVPFTAAEQRLSELQARAVQLREDCIRGGDDIAAIRVKLEKAKALDRSVTEQVKAATGSILEPLDELVSSKREALASAEEQAERIQGSIQKVFLSALGILIAVTLVPVGIKAFWYWLVAPLVEKRPPIRLRPQIGGAPDGVPSDAMEIPAWERISAVSQEIAVGNGEELLVHPDFLQSSANRGRKDTKWLLDWRFPFTSIAAGMVALTRIRTGTPESFMVSSKNDPFAEIGVIPLPEGTGLVLQPRNLVGLVHLIDRPIRIERRWVFSWSAVITLQFRYLIFEGPGRLLVQGCRGVRLERAGSGRSIDSGSTMGFSANLDYSPKRSETFSAYMLGVNGLFNDSFAGGPGFCVYEEMPYAGKRSGITGRGLEGLTDGLLKVMGI